MLCYVEGEDLCHTSKGWMCICLEGRQAKQERMTDIQFAKKDEIARVDILLTL